MEYQCLNCSYIGSNFPDGRCPGCGSARVQKLASEKQKKPLARKPYRLMLAVALWLYLIIEIYKKLH